MSSARSRTYRSEDESAPPQLRPCEASGCDCEGQFRAPKSRDRMTDYYWFCLDHVRTYNRSWDYYAGMKPEQIEAHVRADTTWRRQTWPMGNRPKPRTGQGPDPDIHDPFEIFGGGTGWSRQQESHPRRPANSAEDRALAVMDLSYPVTLDQVKARYKVLAKRFHPDTNGGDKAAEEQLKTINEAYATLRHSLVS